MTKSQQKKAAKRAKERAKREETIQKNETVQSQLSTANIDGRKQAELSCNSDNESEFEFNDIDQPYLRSKFFKKAVSNDSCQTPLNNISRSEDIVSQREEVWEQYMKQRSRKRERNKLSPDNEYVGKGCKKPLIR